MKKFLSASKNLTPDPIVKIGEAANILGVSVKTLRRWDKAGKIKAVRTPGGTRLYYLDSLKKINSSYDPSNGASPSDQLTTTEELLKKSNETEGIQTPVDSAFPDLPDLPTLPLSQIKKPFSLFTPKVLSIVSGLILTVSGGLITHSLLGHKAENLPIQLPQSQVLAALTGPKFLEINADSEVNGKLAVKDSINDLGLDASPSASTFTLTSGGTILSVTKTAKLDQDVSTTSTPSFTSLDLTANKNQIVFQSGGTATGTLTWTPTSNRIITLPDATTTIAGIDTTQTLTNKTISGSSNTFTNIPNSAFSNASITIDPGTNLSGGGAVSLGGSVTLSMKDSVSLSGTLAVTGAATLSSTLAVSGTTAFNGVTYSWPSSQGSSGTALTDDGSGTLSWSSLSSAGGWTDDGTAVRLTTSTDNVGIGTTAPGAKLSVAGNVSIGYTGISPSAPSLGLAVVGRVGIGTSSPASELHVVGNGIFTGSITVGSCSGCGASGTISLDDGSASSPALRFSADSDTGVFRPGTNALGFTTGGTSKLTITEAGNIGIGMTAPAGDLDSSASTFNFVPSVSILNLAGGSSSSGCSIDGSGNFTCTGNIGGGSSGSQGFWARATSPVNVVYPATTSDVIGTFGNVGVGTTNPTSKLQVNGSVALNLGSDATGDLFYRNSSGTLTRLSVGSSGQTLAVSFGVPIWTDISTFTISSAGGWVDAGAYVRLLTSGDNVGIGTTVGQDAIGKLHLRGNTDTTGLTFTTTNNSNSVFGLSVLDNGNVGIGTTLPTYKLQVAGTLGVGNTATFFSDLLPSSTDQINLGTSASLEFNNIYAKNIIASGITLSGGSGGFWSRDTNNGYLYPATLNDKLGVGTSAPSQIFQVNQNPSSAFVVTSGGNVGIGTTSPGGSLIVASGNVGIGVTSPNTSLAVAGNVNIGWTGSTASVLGTGLGLSVKGNVGIGITTANSTLSVAGNEHIGGIYQGITAPANGLFVDGNVGIGATTSGNKLDVWGNERVTGTLTVDGALTGNGNISGNIFLAVNGSASAPSFAFTNSTSTGLWSPLANALALTTNGGATSGINITSAGNVGIGASTANSTLSVAGNEHIGSLRQGISAPANGLFVDGNVGIGATTSNNKLDVWGNARIAGSLTLDSNLTGPITGTVGYFSRSTSLNSTTGLVYPTTITDTVATYGNVGIGTSNPSSSLIVASGNVGLGTLTPTSALHVVSSDSNTNSIVNLLTLNHALSGVGFNVGNSDGLRTSLASYWSLNETSGTSAADSTGLNTGTANGTATADTSTKLLGAASRAFTSNSARITLGDTNSTLNVTATLSINLWAKGATSNPVSKAYFGETTGASGPYLFFWDSGGKLSFARNGAPTQESGYTTNDTNWHMWTVTYDGSTLRFYKDGIAGSVISWTQTFTTGNQYAIGNVGGVNSVDGNIDEVGFWTKPLSQAEITDLYNSGAGDAYSGGGAVGGIGTGILFQDANSVASNISDAQISSTLTAATSGLETSALTFGTIRGGGSITEVMRLTGDGNLGIGTTFPQAKLTVQGNVGIGYTGANQSIPTSGLAVFGNVGIGITTANSALTVNGGVSIGSSNITAPTNGLFVLGNVGIGFTTPDRSLQVGLDVTSFGSSLGTVLGANGTQLALTGSTANTLNKKLVLGLDTTNNVGIIQAGVNLGVGNSAAYNISINPFGGNVGIGTSVPASNLEISGTAPTFRISDTSPTFNATGGTITTSGAYTIHTFTSSGTFTVTSGSVSVDYLVVAGGGGGGPTFAGGGGGGGGVVTGTTTATVQAYTVTVGAGGGSNTNGSNSVFGSITANGGGHGGTGGGSPTPGASGGSGGGGGSVNGSPQSGGAGTAGQGNNGGSGEDSFNYAGGGGGGAGAAGSTSAVDGVGGNGGNGTASSISGSSVTYGGGGGGGSFTTGGSGGTGGGGTGGPTGSPNDGTANTGGGGGGKGAAGGAGANGGSGIVIVRYLTPNPKATLVVTDSNGLIDLKSSSASNGSLLTLDLQNTKIGIGTLTPLSVLDINGGVAVGAFAGNIAAPSNGMIVSGNVGIGASIPQGKLIVQGNVGIGYTGLNQSIPVNGLAVSGNVGIGITTANSALTVNGGVSIGSSNVTAPTNGLFVLGNVGIGFSSPDRNEQNAKDIDITSSSASLFGANGTQFGITGSTANGLTKKLVLGIDTTDNYGVIQAGNTSGTNYTLSLNPAGGNVGIGTTSPTISAGTGVEIQNSGAASLRLTDRAASTFEIQSTNASGNNVLNFAVPGGCNCFDILSGGNVGVNNISPVGQFQVNSGTSSFLVASNGNVGIGFTSPTYGLEVSTSTGVLFRNTTASPVQPAATVMGVHVGANQNFWVGSNGGTLILNAINDANTANIPVMFGASSYNFTTGNVGIGFSSPSQLFQVNGNNPFVVTSGGNVGIGTATPLTTGTKNLTISSNGAGTAYLNLQGSTTANGNTTGLMTFYNGSTEYSYINFFNEGTGTVNSHGMQIVLDNAGAQTQFFRIDNDGTTTLNFTGTGGFFACKTATGSGQKILSACNGSAAQSDITENMVVSGVEDGELVEIDPNGPDESNLPLNKRRLYGRKATGAYTSKVLGVISTWGMKFDMPDGQTPGPDDRPLTTAGVMPTKVSLENGPIHRGDYLTTSSTPGVAMKATYAGFMVAKAIEDFDGSKGNEGKILALLNLVYADPNNFLSSLSMDSDGNLIIPKIKTASIVLDSSVASASAQLSSGNGQIALNSDPNYSNPGPSAQSSSTTYYDLTGKIASLEDRIKESETKIKNLEEIAGVATPSAQIAESTSSATPSANLAEATPSANLADIQSKLTPPDTLFASGSATLANLSVTSEATISGQLTAYDLNISDSLKSLGATSLGKTTIAGDLSVDGTLSIENGSELNVIGTLFLQKSPLATNLDIFNGKVTVDSKGNIKASGEIAGASIVTNKLTISNIPIASSSAGVAPSIGTGNIPAGQTTVTISSEGVDDNSKIFITANKPVLISVSHKDISAKNFTVELATPQSSDISFDWWIIETK